MDIIIIQNHLLRTFWANNMRNLINTLFAAVTYFIINFILRFFDGYLIMNLYQNTNIKIYVLPIVFIVILILLLLRTKNQEYKKRVRVVFSYIITVFFIAWLIKPIDTKIQLHGFKIKTESIWDLEELFQCSESLIEDSYSGKWYKTTYRIYKTDELPTCFNSFFSNQSIKKPNVVIKQYKRYYFVSLEFESYSLSFIPTGFPIPKLLKSIRKGRIIFSYSNRINRSWNKRYEPK